MEGYNVYNNNFEIKIENLISKHQEIKCLRGFYNYIRINRSLTTIYNYLFYVVKFISWTGKEVEDLRIDDYLGYMATMSNKSPKYQIPVYTAIKKLSKYLEISEINVRNPMKDVESPKNIESIETVNKREIGYLTKEECQIYIDSIKNCIGSNPHEIAYRENYIERDLAIITLLLNTGMRCSALYKLDIDSLNFENNSLKTIDKERRIEEHFFSDSVKQILLDWLVKREIMLGDCNESALFISNRKVRMTTSSISRVVNKYAANINGKKITPHKLRATYGTQIYNQTHDLFVVQKCMGHASPKTSELYIRGQKNEGRIQASNIMDDFIF